MEGDVIFNKKEESKAPQAIEGVQTATHNNTSQAPSPPSPPLGQKPLPPPPRPSITGLLIKIVLGILGLVALIFVIFRFVLPMFGGNSGDKVELVYWGLWENENTMRSLIDKFESEHPNISIKYTKQDIKQYNETLQTRINNGTGPDIFRYNSTWVPMLKEELMPLSQEAISPNDFKKNYYPVTQKDLTRDGAIYGIPLEIDTLAMFVNTEIIKEAGISVPSDWNDFVKSAVRITVKDSSGKIKTSGAALGTFDNITHAPDILGMLFVQNGTNTTDMQKTPSNATETLEFYTSFAKGNAAMWDDSLDEALVAFAKGNVGFFFGYSWDVFQIKAINPELEFEIHKVPGLPGRQMSVANYWVEGVSNKTKHPKEAMQFMNYLSQEATVEKLYAEESKTRSFGEPYPFVSLKDKLKDNKLVYPFVEQGPTATSTYFVSNTFDNGINDRMNAYLGNAVRSVLGNTSAQSAVQTLTQGISQVLSVYERQPTITR